eukprot:TRINITY_DN2761_c0_g1_i7.p1 TRINITY_DN2761_c0_g1~~TRINITY_DN2761_c0_g1_i7.p1  ORF type:complete len:267 (-),score=114.57 TRINITY_DN2761_c0_g1_i7:175-975(-)
MQDFSEFLQKGMLGVKTTQQCSSDAALAYATTYKNEVKAFSHAYKKWQSLSATLSKFSRSMVGAFALASKAALGMVAKLLKPYAALMPKFRLLEIEAAPGQTTKVENQVKSAVQKAVTSAKNDANKAQAAEKQVEAKVAGEVNKDAKIVKQNVQKSVVKAKQEYASTAAKEKVAAQQLMKASVQEMRKVRASAKKMLGMMKHACNNLPNKVKQQERKQLIKSERDLSNFNRYTKRVLKKAGPQTKQAAKKFVKAGNKVTNLSLIHI